MDIFRAYRFIFRKGRGYAFTYMPVITAKQHRIVAVGWTYVSVRALFLLAPDRGKTSVMLGLFAFVRN